MARWRGLKALVHDAVDATTSLVGEGHDAAHRNVRRVTDRIAGIAGPARDVGEIVRAGTAGTLGAVRAVNRVVEGLTDVAIDATSSGPGSAGEAVPMRSDVMGTAGWVGDAALGAVNGAVGHHLAATGNGLDLGLQLRVGDRYLAQDDGVDGPVVVLVHGLGTTEWCWCLDAAAHHGDPAATFGSLLARDAGLTPIFVRYNTGRRVVDSGRALAAALEASLGRTPRRVVLVGHSMGGLVARAACAAASVADHGWLAGLDLVVSLGTPHQGAGLARLGEAVSVGLGGVDLPATRVLSRILAGRSSGIRDLEHGDLGGGDVPLLDGVRYAFLSATVAQDPAHPASRWLGDLMVQVGSASGPARASAFPPSGGPGGVVINGIRPCARAGRIRFPARDGPLGPGFPIDTGTFGGVLHHQLQCHPDVYAKVAGLVGDRAAYKTR